MTTLLLLVLAAQGRYRQGQAGQMGAIVRLILLFQRREELVGMEVLGQVAQGGALKP